MDHEVELPELGADHGSERPRTRSYLVKICLMRATLEGGGAHLVELVGVVAGGPELEVESAGGRAD
jgi:hypothetical protein